MRVPTIQATREAHYAVPVPSLAVPISVVIINSESQLIHGLKSLGNVVEDDVTGIHDLKVGGAVLSDVALEGALV